MAILGMALLQVIGIASILPFMQLVAEPEVMAENSLLKWGYDQFEFESTRSMLIASGFVVLGLIAIGNGFSAFTTWLQFKYAWEIAHNLSTRLLRNYLSRPYSFFLKHNTSDLLNKTLVEVSYFTRGVLVPIIDLAARSLIVLVIFALLVWADPKLAVIVSGVLGIAYLIIFMSTRSLLGRLGEERIKANEGLFRSLTEALTGIKTIRVYNAEALFYKRFKRASARRIKIHPRVNLVSTAPRFLVEVLAFGSILSITLYLLIKGGDLKSLLPMLSLYALAGYRLLPALQNAFKSAANLKHSFPTVDRICQDLGRDSLPQLEDQNYIPEITLKPFSQDITMENIRFKYEGTDQTTIDNLNVRIEKGTTVAFVGATGSGKTTLVNLIVGLFLPREGALKIDGVKITESNVRAWNRQIGYVPQDVFMFDDTIARNIAIGFDDEEIDMNRIEEVARLANIHDFIFEELPDRYQNVIGDRGVRLSGGQKQRLGLARALYGKPEVLILDEATSALDNITENAVIESLKEATNSLTVIIIAHRLSTVKHADCIYLLKDGKIIAEGPYETLLDTSEIFREMVQLS